MIIQYIIPLGVILFLYVEIIKELKKSSKNLIRTKQSSTDSNAISIDNLLVNRRYVNPAFNYGSMKRNSTFTNGQSDIFKINLAERTTEVNNNFDRFIVNDLKLNESNDSVNQIKEKLNETPKLIDFKRINLIKLPLVNGRHLKKSTNNDFTKQRSSSLKERLDRKMINNSQSQSSNESQMIVGNQSISTKLSILDDELDRTKRRLTKMMILVVVVFGLAWFPVSYHLQLIKIRF